MNNNERQCLNVLKLTRNNWENRDDRYITRIPFQNLLEEHKPVARTLGYSNGDSVPTGLGYYKFFNKMKKSEKTAIRKLGFAPKQWNTPEIRSQYLRNYSKLMRQHQLAATTLGYTNNSRVPILLGINRKYNTLSEIEQAAVTNLGLTKNMWDNPQNTSIQHTHFHLLNKPKQKAAKILGYSGADRVPYKNG